MHAFSGRDALRLNALRLTALAPIIFLLSACGEDGVATTAQAVQIATPDAASVTAVDPVADVATLSASADPADPADAAASFSVTSAAVTATAVPAKPSRGINISGGEFGGGKAPGKMFTNYIYPTKPEIDYYVRLGFTVIRVPFMWERIQPKLYGPLSVADQQALRDVVTYATGKGLIVVLDMHNYAQRAIGADYQTVVEVGSTQVPVSALVDAWARLMTDYRKNGYVWIGLMNEPYTMTAAKWWPIAKKLVLDIRARGFYNKILVPGTNWSGAHSWISSGNAANVSGLKDPANNFAIEIHQYLDADSSGTTPNCAVGAGARVADVISWAKSKNVKLFMGEMGAGAGTQCGIEYRDMLNRMEVSGVFRGWTAWGGGTWWNASYPFRTITTTFPDTSTTTPHMKYLLEYVND